MSDRRCGPMTLDGREYAFIRLVRKLTLTMSTCSRLPGDSHHAASNDPGAAESSHSMEMRYCAPASCPELVPSIAFASVLYTGTHKRH